jgi:hypothetical protein
MVETPDHRFEQNVSWPRDMMRTRLVRRLQHRSVSIGDRGASDDRSCQRQRLDRGREAQWHHAHQRHHKVGQRDAGEPSQ